MVSFASSCSAAKQDLHFVISRESPHPIRLPLQKRESLDIPVTKCEITLATSDWSRKAKSSPSSQQEKSLQDQQDFRTFDHSYIVCYCYIIFRHKISAKGGHNILSLDTVIVRFDMEIH